MKLFRITPTLLSTALIVLFLYAGLGSSAFASTLESDQLRLFQSLPRSTELSSTITLDKLQARSSVGSLGTLEGSSSETDAPLWIFCVKQSGRSMTLGETRTNDQGEFSFQTGEQNSSISGDIQLIVSHLPDIQLALAVPEKTLIVPLTIYRNEKLEQVSQQDPFALSLDQVDFYQGDKLLNTLQSETLKVYAPNNANSIRIHLQGKLFGDNIAQAQLFSTILPVLQQDHHLSNPEDPELLDLSIEVADLPFAETIKLVLQGQEVAFPDANQQAQVSVSFELHPEEEMPTSAAIIWNNTGQDKLSLLLFTLTVFTFFFFVIFHIRQRSILKVITILLIICELGFLGYHSTVNSLRELFEAGLLEIPGQELVIQRQRTQAPPSLTLTRLDENLEVVPALSTSWSNISPTIWEFTLRTQESGSENTGLLEELETGLANLLEEETTPSEPAITAPEVIRALKNFLDQQQGQQQFLASIKQIVGINANRIQFITRFPDPILPQKLSKVELRIVQDGEELTGNSQLYLSLESFSDHTRARRNDDYFDLKFIENNPIYRSEIFTSNLDQLKHEIKQGSADILDDPEPILWPNLFQENYSIVPRINTQSVFLYLNRNSFVVKNPLFVEALKKIIQTPSVLQTSYYQYGQLAQQFAPPGVVGYDPELNPKYISANQEDSENGETVPEKSAEELLSLAKEELGVSDITLTLNYPDSEARLAGVIESELETKGINVIPKAFADRIDDDDLAQDLPDLVLLSMDFDLGDVGPFLDTLIDSNSPINSYYQNNRVDELIKKSRSELNRFTRLELIQEIMSIIVDEDPAGIPLLFKRSFTAKKKPVESEWWEELLQQIVLGWK